MDRDTTCEQFRYWAWQQPVSLPTAERMKLHSDSCEECREYLAFVATRLNVTTGFPKAVER